MRRINDVNPRNGSATSLANSQFSPLLSPGPPALPCPTSLPSPETSLSLSLSVSSFPHPPFPDISSLDSNTSLSPLFCSGPIPTRPELQARPGRRTFALSCRLYVRFVAPVVFTCLQHHSLTTPVRRSSPLPVSLRTLLHRHPRPPSPFPGILPPKIRPRNNRLARRRSSRSR